MIAFDQRERSLLTGFDTSAARNAFERLFLTLCFSHGMGWAKADAHEATDTDVFLDHHRSDFVPINSFYGADINAFSALIADVDRVLAVFRVDSD